MSSTERPGTKAATLGFLDPLELGHVVAVPRKSQPFPGRRGPEITRKQAPAAGNYPMVQDGRCHVEDDHVDVTSAGGCTKVGSQICRIPER